MILWKSREQETALCTECSTLFDLSPNEIEKFECPVCSLKALIVDLARNTGIAIGRVDRLVVDAKDKISEIGRLLP